MVAFSTPTLASDVIAAGNPHQQQQQQQQQDNSTRTDDDNPTAAAAAAPHQQVVVEVDDYLTSLSDTQLRTICFERGFDMAPRPDGHTFVREDYLEAARRCMSLEHEMNAILAANPDLAAELDVEIERMKLERERLQHERQDMLDEMAMLQQQLEQAGMDVRAYGLRTAQDMEQEQQEKQPPSYRNGNSGNNDTTPLTVQQVLEETLGELYRRVHRDFNMVIKVLRPILQPIVGACHLIWRYSKPMMVEVYIKGRDMVQKWRKGQQDDTVEATNDDSSKSRSAR
jgi:hypothetical protein